MNKKKIMSILLASILVTGTAANALADDVKMIMPKQIICELPTPEQMGVLSEMETIKKEEALKAAKDFLKKNTDVEINDDFKQYCNLNSYSIGRVPVWNINFMSQNENDIYSVDVSINAVTGEVTGFSLYKNNESDMPEISYSEAQKKAVNKMKEIFPEKMKSVIIENNGMLKANYGGDYGFTFVREDQGIKYTGNYITARIDGKTGELIGFNLLWEDDIEFPNVKNAMGVDKAEDILLDSMEIAKKYRLYSNKYRFQEKENKKNIKLVYDLNMENGKSIDATTGEFFWKRDDYKQEVAELNKTELNKILSKYKETNDLSKPLEEEEAKKLATEFVEKYYGEDFKVEGSSYSENDYEGKNFWRVGFTKEVIGKEDGKEKKTITNVDISIDANTGELYSSSKYDRITVDGQYFYSDEKVENKFTWEEAYQKAVDFLGEEFKGKLKNLDYRIEREVYTNRKGIPTEDKKFRYSFKRVENGVSFESNYVSVEIDAVTGAVTNVYQNWFKDAEFVSIEKAKEESEIRKIVEGKYSPELSFIKVDDKIRLSYEYKGDKDAYNFNDMDAFTADLLDYSGEIIFEDTEAFFKEIEKSDYAKELEILAYSGIMDIREFKLDKEVSKKDLIKAMADAFGYRTYSIVQEREAVSDKAMYSKAEDNSGDYQLSDEDYLKMAEFYGIVEGKITKDSLSEKVTKMDVVKAMIKFTGYEDIAEINSIFKVDSKDASKIKAEEIGYAALAVGFDIAKIEDGKFNPDSKVDSEELFRSLFYALKNKQQSNNVIRPYLELK